MHQLCSDVLKRMKYLEVRCLLKWQEQTDQSAEVNVKDEPHERKKKQKKERRKKEKAKKKKVHAESEGHHGWNLTETVASTVEQS